MQDIRIERQSKKLKGIIRKTETERLDRQQYTSMKTGNLSDADKTKLLI